MRLGLVVLAGFGWFRWDSDAFWTTCPPSPRSRPRLRRILDHRTTEAPGHWVYEGVTLFAGVGRRLAGRGTGAARGCDVVCGGGEAAGGCRGGGIGTTTAHRSQPYRAGDGDRVEANAARGRRPPPLHLGSPCATTPRCSVPKPATRQETLVMSITFHRMKTGFPQGVHTAPHPLHNPHAPHQHHPYPPRDPWYHAPQPSPTRSAPTPSPVLGTPPINTPPTPLSTDHVANTTYRGRTRMPPRGVVLCSNAGHRTANAPEPSTTHATQ